MGYSHGCETLRWITITESVLKRLRTAQLIDVTLHSGMRWRRQRHKKTRPFFEVFRRLTPSEGKYDEDKDTFYHIGKPFWELLRVQVPKLALRTKLFKFSDANQFNWAINKVIFITSFPHKSIKLYARHQNKRYEAKIIIFIMRDAYRHAFSASKARMTTNAWKVRNWKGSVTAILSLSQRARQQPSLNSLRIAAKETETQTLLLRHPEKKKWRHTESFTTGAYHVWPRKTIGCPMFRIHWLHGGKLLQPFSLQ